MTRILLCYFFTFFQVWAVVRYFSTFFFFKFSNTLFNDKLKDRFQVESTYTLDKELLNMHTYRSSTNVKTKNVENKI